MSAIEWGTVGEWFGGVMAAAAVGAAIWAVHGETKAREALERRLERERRQEEERQARRISFVATPYVEGRGPDKRPIIAVAFEVENESDQTITDVRVVATIAPPESGSVVLYSEGCQKLAPTGRYGSESRSKALQREADHYDPPLRSNATVDDRSFVVPSDWVTTMATFTDAEGRRWETRGAGELARADPV